MFLTAGLALSSSASAKEKTLKQLPRSWRTIIEYVIKNGDTDFIRAPSSRTIGFSADEIPTISLGIEDDKSKDGQEHNLDVVYEKSEKGVITPKEFVVGTVHVKESGALQEVDSYRIRVALDGTIIRGMHATGIVGHVVQKALSGDSPELKSVFKKESALYLKEIDLGQLTR